MAADLEATNFIARWYSIGKRPDWYTYIAAMDAWMPTLIMNLSSWYRACFETVRAVHAPQPAAVT